MTARTSRRTIAAIVAVAALLPATIGFSTRSAGAPDAPRGARAGAAEARRGGTAEAEARRGGTAEAEARRGGTAEAQEQEQTTAERLEALREARAQGTLR